MISATILPPHLSSAVAQCCFGPLSAAIAAGAITLAVVWKGTASGAQVGVALHRVLVTNTTLLRLVSCTTLEISFGAFARMKTLESETPEEEEQASRKS